MSPCFPIHIECFSSVQVSHSVVSDSLQPHRLQHSRPPCPSLTPGEYSNSSTLRWWCHPTISSFVVCFSSCLQSFPSGSFLMSQLFASGDQSIRVSTSASVLPANIQDWFPLEWTGLVSLQSKGLSRVFSNTTVQNTCVINFVGSKYYWVHDCWNVIPPCTYFTKCWHKYWVVENMIMFVNKVTLCQILVSISFFRL